MSTSRPADALIYRPSGEAVLLDTPPDEAQLHIEVHGSVERWTIGHESTGTVWTDGKAAVVPIYQGAGTYRLYLADNLETEPENTFFIQCDFAWAGPGG